MRFDVDAALFDIDGTLVDSTPVVEQAWRVWAAQFGLDADAILRVSHGRRSQDTVADFVAEPERAAALEVLDDYEMTHFDGIVALPGAAQLLGSIPADRWASVTSGGAELMRRRLASAGVPVPGILVAAEDVAAGKPNPEGYLLGASRLGVDAARCVVFEDAPAGIAAGKAAGSVVVGISTSHAREQLMAADVVVDSLENVHIATTVDGRLTVTVA